MPIEMASEVIHARGFHILVWLHTEVDPPEDQWSATVARLVDEVGALPSRSRRGLVVSDGGAPNLGQRATLHEALMRDPASKSAVLTTVLSNPIKRGVATALRWMNPAYAFYRPEEFPKALGYLDLDGEIPIIREAYARLQRAMRPVKSLRTIL